MEPVVNGLQREYGKVIEFRALNAGFGEGQTAFLFYALPGHPGVVIVSMQGEVLWKGVGVLTEAELRAAIEAVLE